MDINNNILYFKYGDLKNTSPSELIRNNKNTTLIISHILEFFFDYDVELLNEELKESNSNMYVLLSCHRYDIIDNDISGKITNLHFLFFPYYLMRKAYFNSKQVVDSLIEKKTETFDSLFIYPNHKIKGYRLESIDLLHKYKLENYGNFSLGGNEANYIDHSLYSSKYWIPTITHLDNPIDVHGDHSHHWGYFNNNNSLINLVSETIFGTDLFYLTEKTSKPLLYGQLFLSLGCNNFHNKLKDIGFQIYDEIFDYSFDTMTGTTKIENFILQIDKIKDENYNELYNIVRDKISYNQKLSFDILKNRNTYTDDISNNFLNKNITIFKDMVNTNFIENYII